MKRPRILLPILFLLAALGCGYSKPTGSTPASSKPAISQLNPASVSAGSGQFQMEVDGSHFASGAVVNFNGAAVTTNAVSSTKLEATVPASAVMNAGTVPVTVTNPGTSGIYGTAPVTSAAMNFTIN